MQISSAIRTILTLAATACTFAQQPAVAPEAQDLPPRTTPTDYQVVAKAGTVTIAAEFTGHGIPNAQEPLNSEDHVAVEVGIFGPPGRTSDDHRHRFLAHHQREKDSSAQPTVGFGRQEHQGPGMGAA